MAMTWPPDIPDLPIKKPHVIETLEKMDFASFNAMRDWEIEEHIYDAAHGFAKNYFEKYHGSYEDCRSMVALALELTGSALGGNFGLAMVARSKPMAEEVSKDLFKEQ